MTTSQKQLRLKQQQRQQRVNAVKYAKQSGARNAPLLLPPPIPQALLDIIVRCLAPDRNQRFQVMIMAALMVVLMLLLLLLMGADCPPVGPSRLQLLPHVQVQDLAFVLSLLRRLFYMSSSVVYPRLMSLRYYTRCNNSLLPSAAAMCMLARFNSLSVLNNALPSHPTTT
jgi:hypothetical protein